MTTEILSYDPAAYPFRSLISQYIGLANLEELSATYDTDPRSRQFALQKYGAVARIQGNVCRPSLPPKGSSFTDFTNASSARSSGRSTRALFTTRPSPVTASSLPDVPGQSRFHRDADYGHDPAEVQLLGSTYARLRYQHLLDRK